MRKKRRFQLPDPPDWPIRTLDRYDKFYREKLRKAVRDDFEEFVEGLPTYHSFITDIVEAYAADVADPSGLNPKDLENFLRGRNSHVPKIKVLDAYMQIVNPNRAKGFSQDRYTKYIGEAFSEFLGSPEFVHDGYSRASAMQSLAGVYRVMTHFRAGRARGVGNEARRDAPLLRERILVLDAGVSSTFLITYDFYYGLQAKTAPSLPSENLDLASGITVPFAESGLMLMRDTKSLRRIVARAVIRDLNADAADFFSDPNDPDLILFTSTFEAPPLWPDFLRGDLMAPRAHWQDFGELQYAYHLKDSSLEEKIKKRVSNFPGIC